MPHARYFTISRADTPTQSALTYVPIVILSRGLAFLRILLVAKILGDAGQREFGLYQPALELINWIVPLIMFGLADVAERYAARFEKEARLPSALKRHLLRIFIIGLSIILILLAASPWLSYQIFRIPDADHSRAHGILLIVACAATSLLLALYQYLSALLRGLRAYAPAAGMEFIASLLFFILSALAALRRDALALVLAYAIALLLPMLYFASLLFSHLKSQAPPPIPSDAPSPLHQHFDSFAAWSLLRLLLVMSFGFISFWSFSFLVAVDPHTQTANFSMPYRIAQILAYIAVTLWASCYGIAARNWSHHQTRRAKVQFLRVGKFGAVFLTLAAILLLLARPLFAAILPPAYADAINLLLPPMLALFIWYGLLTFASTYADLHETPQKGALLWLAAVLIQLTLILLPPHSSLVISHSSFSPGEHVLLASSAGLAFSLLLLAPILLWRPFRFTATAIPLALLAIAPFSLFSPPWIVDVIAPIVLLAAIAFLFITGLLIRPIDRRAWRRFRVIRRRSGDVPLPARRNSP